MDEPRSLSRLANRFDERFELSIDGGTQQFLSRTKVMINVASVDTRPRSDFSQIETGQDALPVPMVDSWGEAARYAQLRLLRERLEILEMLMRSGIELDTRQLCDLLELRRLPAVQPLDDGRSGFVRLGLQFSRQQRMGQRSSWMISRA